MATAKNANCETGNVSAYNSIETVYDDGYFANTEEYPSG